MPKIRPLIFLLQMRQDLSVSHSPAEWRVSNFQHSLFPFLLLTCLHIS